MLRLSLPTLWELHAGKDPTAIESIHDYMFYEMEEVRHGIYYNACLNKIELLPLKETIMNKKEFDTDTEKQSGAAKLACDVIDLVTKNLSAVKAWIKFSSKR